MTEKKTNVDKMLKDVDYKKKIKKLKSNKEIKTKIASQNNPSINKNSQLSGY